MGKILTDEEMNALEASAAPKKRVLSDDEMFALEGSQRPPVDKGVGDAIMRGVAQGGTLGFADELTAGAGALKDWGAAKLGLRGDVSLADTDDQGRPQVSIGDVYDSYINGIRGKDDQSQSQHPVAFGGGELAGTVAASIVAPGLNAGRLPTLAGRLGTAAAEGAVTGAGHSKESLTENPLGLAKDAAISAGTGLLAQGGGELLGAGLKKGADTVGDLIGSLGGRAKKSGEELAGVAAGVGRDADAGRMLIDDKVVTAGADAAGMGKRATSQAASHLDEMDDILRQQNQSALYGEAPGKTMDVYRDLERKLGVKNAAADSLTAKGATPAPALIDDMKKRGMKMALNAATGGKAAIAEKAVGLAKNRGLSTAAIGLDKIGTLLQSAPERFGRFGGQMQKAASRGPHALAVTHFLLMSSDPDYRKQLEQGDDL